jgi:hypothetical protein
MKNISILILSTLILSGCAGTAVVQDHFEIEIVNLPGEKVTRHIKYNKVTGEAWWASNTEWKKILETEPIQNSVYDIKVVSTKGSWRALRIDKISGKTWKNSGGKWVPFTILVNE